MGNEKRPKIRFPEFTDDWEQRKLGDVIEQCLEKNTDMIYGINDAIGVTLTKEMIPTYANMDESTDVSNFYLVNPRCFVYNPRTHGKKIGLGLNTSNHTYIVTFNDTVFKIKDYQADENFLHIYLSREEWDKEACAISLGTSTIVLKWNVLCGMTFIAPSVEEQRKISELIVNLDNLITLHQRKYDAVKLLKRSMLQKMFPKEGEYIPEIRFPEFNDVWEQRKLSDIYKDIGNAFVGTATPYYVEKGHFYLESNNIKDGQINHNTEVFINDEFYEKQKDKWLHAGDMVMVQSGHVGHAAVIPEELDCSAAHALIMFRSPKIEIEPYFLNYQYQTTKSKKKIENITTGNTIKHILASEMQEFIVNVTSYGEQKKIAGFFRNIDNLITLHQRKLEQIKKYKKFLLQNMFL